MNDIYKLENVQEAIQNPKTPPSDLLGLRSSIYQKYGVSDYAQQAQKAYEALQNFNQNTISQLNQAQDQLLGMNKIRGIQSKISRDRAIQEQGLASAYNALANQYKTALAQAQDEFSTIQSEWDYKNKLRLSYPEAGIDDNDTIEKAMEKIQKFAKKQAENEAFERVYGVSLSARPKGMSKKEWRKKLEKEMKRKQEFEALKEQLTLEKLQTDIANTRSIMEKRNQPIEPSDAEIRAANENLIYSTLMQLPRGEDGFVDPADWKPLLEEWMNAGGTYSEFLQKFSGSTNEYGERTKGFINPRDL